MTRALGDSKRLAVFLANGLGDQLIALPAIRALGELFPVGMHLMLGAGMYGFFYRGVPLCCEHTTAHWADFNRAMIDVERTASAAHPCDVFISLSTWVTTSVLELGRRLGARKTIGFHGGFDERVEVDECVHMFDRLFAIPRHLVPTVAFDTFSSPPLFSPAAEAAAERYIDRVRRSGERVLFVHPETRLKKMWTPERFSWVLQQFLRQRSEYKVVVTSQTGIRFEVEQARERVTYTDAHLELALAIMKRADLFLGIDSCFLHAADLCRLPGVALFGPSDPCHWGFRVSPRFRHICGRSMDEIDRDRVLDGLIELADPERVPIGAAALVGGSANTGC